MTKIALVCSHGGHLTQIEALWPVLAEHDCFLVCHPCQRTENLDLVRRTYLIPNIGTNVFLMTWAFLSALFILLRERPDVVLSTGSEIAIPFIWIGKLLGAKTVYIETWARIQSRSGTGPLVYRAADLFLVQWPGVLNLYGPKARYEGSLL